MSEKQIRRNIHTYPFKYSHLAPDVFFERERAVIYLHIPFCNTKCHFCDYVVYTNTSEDLRAAYVDALRKEIRAFSENRAFPGFKIDAVYVGGGTPGVLTSRQLISILETICETFPVTSDCEVAVEFDPGSVTYEKVKELRDAGYTRMSLGVQSFDEDILKQNNRPHVLKDVFTAWEAIQRAGYAHTNLDLIYPLLGLDLKNWEASLRQAIQLDPTCITAYPLEVWPQTAYHHWLFKAKSAQLPSGGVEVDMCRMSYDMLESAGYRRYSTSGYFDPKRVDTYSRYLEYYWRTWPLIGFGVSSKTVIHDRLYTNVRPIKEYLERSAHDISLMDIATRITKEQEMRRVMIRGIKMCEVSKSDFQRRFGLPIELMFGREMKRLIDRGLIEEGPDTYSLTREGQVFSTNVWETFFTEEDLRPATDGEVQFGLSELVLT
ncbi:radical SAM family heme chaperone HemW [Bradyrhizobium ontarionense]|uniref:Heme chaperone HemW n=1 Tax=Bradyrhizobium ontarionense TaxID=2898149 RepID=A0ABY3R7T7_9BRAD|nr:radical SAM family heme chaperone HemW [Bradyrhizobium sp. A19]UFZ03306.1 radical SAM family heme chaperone HemW [Bradyrhizobium sp. A19]